MKQWHKRWRRGLWRLLWISILEFFMFWSHFVYPKMGLFVPKTNLMSSSAMGSKNQFSSLVDHFDRCFPHATGQRRPTLNSLRVLFHDQECGFYSPPVRRLLPSFTVSPLAMQRRAVSSTPQPKYFVSTRTKYVATVADKRPPTRGP